MQKVRIFTNSGSDMSLELAKEFNITLIPDIVIFDNEELLNNIDIDAQSFYARLKTAKNLPKSAHPNLFQFCSSFESASDCEEILYLSITSKMSGSFNTANIVSRDLSVSGFGPRITVYDSLQVSYGLTIMAIRASKLSMEGKSVAEIVKYLDNLQKNIGVYFIMPSLKYARMGGRVGTIKCFTVDAIGIKPILCFSDGLVREAGFSRGMKAAEKAVFVHYLKEADFNKDVFVFHSNNQSSADEMCKRINEVAPNAKVRIEWVGAAIGIYTGEGVIGLAFEKRL